MPTPITASLAAITTTWPQLLADTHTLRGSTSSGMPTASSDGPALPGGTGRLSAIADTTRVLQAWVRVILEDHPGHQLTGEHLEDGVPGLCHWLHPHADWLDEHTAGAAAEELADLADSLTALITPSAVKRPPVGPCVLPGPDGQPCEGTIRGYIDTDHDDTADLACDTDPDHRWVRDHWVDLATQLGHHHPSRMTTRQLAGYLTAAFGRTITPAGIRKWAERDPAFRYLRDHRDDLWDRIRATTWHMDRFPQHPFTAPPQMPSTTQASTPIGA